MMDWHLNRLYFNFFNYKAKILRFPLDGSKRYGYGIKINQIKILNELEYEEIGVDKIYPNSSMRIIATHRINSISNSIVIDGNNRSRVF